MFFCAFFTLFPNNDTIALFFDIRAHAIDEHGPVRIIEFLGGLLVVVHDIIAIGSAACVKEARSACIAAQHE